MKHIVVINFADNDNYTHNLDFAGQKFRLSIYGTGKDVDLTKKLILKFDGMVDAIGLSGLPAQVPLKDKTFQHPTARYLLSLPKHTPLVDGTLFRDTYIPWVLREFCLKNPSFLQKQKVGFYCGALQKRLLSIIEEFAPNILLADPYFLCQIPMILHGTKNLETFIKTFAPLLEKLPVGRKRKSDFHLARTLKIHPLHDFTSCHVFFATSSMLNFVDLSHLKDKTIVVDYLKPELEKNLKQAGVRKIINCTPPVMPGLHLNYSTLEAIFSSLKEDKLPLNSNDILYWIDRLNLKPAVESVGSQEGESRTPSKFAFIVHPLHVKQCFNHPTIKWLKPFSKELGPLVENAINMAPGFYYGSIKGIVSESTGQEVEGLIYTMTGTPRKLLTSPTEKVYQKLVSLCEDAASSGAAIIGLGAYTKIVGDAGVTVARQSPIPVTTGNSLSAAATIWAAKWAVRKMGFVRKNEQGIYEGKAMIIGATGSIGAVSAQILAQNWKEIVLVAPRAHKLLELKESIKKIAPKIICTLATDPNTYARECDLIITTTSGQGEKVIDIMQVRPGAVICDVSRPFDISEEEVLKRPDVLVIASGEVELPGATRINCNIGLQGNIVYACLAETALLALEGRLESFTLSRQIHYQKVKEIDQMARKHGVRLAAITGHTGIITDREIELCKEHALQFLSPLKHEEKKHE